MTVVESEPNASFQELLHQYIGEGTTPFLGLFHITLDTYLIMLSVKQGGIKCHFLSLRYDSTWDWTSVFRAIDEHSTRPMCWRYIYIYIYLYICPRRDLYFLNLSILLLHTFYTCIYFQLVAFVREHIWYTQWDLNSLLFAIYIYIYMCVCVSVWERDSFLEPLGHGWVDNGEATAIVERFEGLTNRNGISK